MTIRLGLLALLLTSPVAAADDAPAEDAPADIGNLLEAIPEITTPQTETLEEPTPVVQDVSFQDYVDQVRAALLSGWSAPAAVHKKDPRAAVQMLVQVGDDGSILELATIESTGNKKLEKALDKYLATIGKLPAPLPAFAGDAAQGMMVTFRAR